MIQSLGVTNYRGNTEVFELGNSEKTGIIITNITGISPGSATINISESGSSDGGTYNSARLSSRNIVIYMNFDKGFDSETLRTRLYELFPLKKEILLLFVTDTRNSYITGNVETLDIDIFNSEVSVQISIICPFPYFFSLNEKTTLFSGVDPLFEFPFENNDLNESMIEFGAIINDKEQTVYYEGDSDVGFTMKIHTIGSVSGIITIYNKKTKEYMKIDTSKILTGGLQSSDDIVISTVKGNKYATLLREGISYNILDSILLRESSWLSLIRGDNIFIYTAETGEDNLQFSISNNILYEGV